MVTAMIAMHYLPLLMALSWWSQHTVQLNWRSISADVLGIPSVLIVLLSIPYMSRVGAYSFFVLSAGTLGALPLVTIGAHVLAGRFLGLAAGKGWRALKRAK